MRDVLARWGAVILAAVLAAIVIAGLLLSTPPTDRAEEIASQLRCPVCQSESVADSTAATARQMRSQIDRFVAEGRSDDEIFAFYEARYGRWIRLAPPLAWDTIVLWTAPVVALLAGAIAIGRRRREQPPPTLGVGDRQRLEAELTRRRHHEDHS